MNTDTGVYSITSPSGKQYIGSSAFIKRRWEQHLRLLRAGRHHSKMLQHAWNKYGEENMIFAKIALCSITDLLIVEQVRINKLRPAYNVALIAGAPMLGRKASAETRAKLSASIKGENHPLWGTVHSAETRAKISASRKGQQLSAESIAKMAASNMGALNHLARAVCCIEMGVEFATVTAAVTWLREGGKLRATTTALSRACVGKRRSAYGYTWRYADGPEKLPVVAGYRSGLNNHRSRAVVCVETGAHFINGLAVESWLRSTGHNKASSSSISAACKGKLFSTCGFTWRYAD